MEYNWEKEHDTELATHGSVVCDATCTGTPFSYPKVDSFATQNLCGKLAKRAMKASAPQTSLDR